MQPGDEIVLIVDADNKPLGKVPRKIMRQQGLIHRASYILVFNRTGEILVQKRTLRKDIYPGYYDVATGGVLLADEEWDAAAARELAEELGVHKARLTAHFDFYHEDDGNRVWGRLFSARCDGPFRLQEEEVAEAFFLPVEEALSLSEKEPFTPDGIMVLKRFLAGGGG